MEPNPYTFSQTNPRLALNIERPSTVTYGAAAVFLFSLHLYNRRFFRKDANAINFLGFAIASIPASYAYSSFFLSNAVIEAGIVNNERESKHWEETPRAIYDT